MFNTTDNTTQYNATTSKQIGNTNPSAGNWEIASAHNYQSMTDYLDSLFDRHARLLVVRLDLYFSEGSAGHLYVEHTRACFARLMNNLRSCHSFIKNKLGYIWRLEFGQDRGFHYHCIFIFNGAKSQQDQSLGHAIGQYWRDVITEGTGTYHCCNDFKADYQRQGNLGIGMIHRNDLEMRYHLFKTASYLMKPDPLIKSMLPAELKRVRTFGRGEL